MILVVVVVDSQLHFSHFGYALLGMGCGYPRSGFCVSPGRARESSSTVAATMRMTPWPLLGRRGWGEVGRGGEGGPGGVTGDNLIERRVKRRRAFCQFNFAKCQLALDVQSMPLRNCSLARAQ